MKASFITIAACALMAVSACSKEDADKEDANSMGNGPGEADGFGGREDPPNGPSANDSSARDAAPGRLSETAPPSTTAGDAAEREPSTDDSR